jgi:hypothetical protein
LCVIDLVKEVAAEFHRIEREFLGHAHFIPKDVAVRVILLVHLGAFAESIVIAPVKTANVRVPGGVL